MANTSGRVGMVSVAVMMLLMTLFVEKSASTWDQAYKGGIEKDWVIGMQNHESSKWNGNGNNPIGRGDNGLGDEDKEINYQPIRKGDEVPCDHKDKDNCLKHRHQANPYKRPCTDLVDCRHNNDDESEVVDKEAKKGGQVKKEKHHRVKKEKHSNRKIKVDCKNDHHSARNSTTKKSSKGTSY